MKKKTLRLLAWLLVFVVLVSSASAVVMAAPEEQQTTGTIDQATVDSVVYGTDYVSYQNKNASVNNATEDIVIPAINYSAESDSGVAKGEIYGEQDVLIWESEKGSVSYSFNVPADAIYNFTLEYVLLDSSERDLDFGIMIDGEFPFDEANRLELPRIWTDATEFRVDEVGNQFASEQMSYQGFVKKSAFDASGASVYPMEFFMSAGNHTITIVVNSEALAIKSVALTVPDSSAPTYKELAEEYAAKGYKSATGAPIVIEGENADLKSTRSLVPYADNSSNLVTPSSPTISQINYIGGTNWKLPNEEITWYIEVPADGLYKLGIRFKQDQVINGFSYRHLRIDGKTPFAECTNLQFNYDTKWQDFKFGDENGEYEFYLTAGTHKLSLSGTMGNLAPSYYKLKEITSNIGNLYLEIVMITSESPDRNRDYELFKTVPQFNERLTLYSQQLGELVAEMQNLSGEKGSSYIAAMNNMARVLDSMVKEKYDSHLYVSDYFTQYTTLSSWLYEMQAMALCLDQIQLVPSDSEFDFKESNFFGKLAFGTRRFLASFDEAYSRISVSKEGGKTIKIWVNWGRDQAQVLNNLINESFVPYAEEELGYPVSVNLELVNADIIKGMLSGNAPDLSLHMARSTPVNLALRGALVDLKQFDDYEETLERFGDTASVPYEYNGGVYALPDQQSFYIMFYRTDIFEQLEIEPPTLENPWSWEDYLAVTAVLQRNNMNSYLPYTKISNAAVVNTGVGGLSLFCSILMQFGGEIYNEARDYCLLDSPTSLQAFTYWTDMHTKYKIPTEASFYNRFRVGTMPLGIMAYTQYTTLAEAAPEIAGRWAIATIPGVERTDENGNTYIDQTISGSGTGCSILETSENQLEAWTFLKWWTAADTQSRYNTNVESIIGTISRITTANLKAFEDMAWERGDLEILLKQREWIVEVPEVPGSYYVSRSVDQAFWNVVNVERTAKDALTKWALEANNEIERKIAEYS
ncbi:MAG: extracellular solute-binding protein [Acutalibacteraceae bacterium]|nr:extracellular solute-binding protein [Acutalibacteraceae bacterium]